MNKWLLGCAALLLTCTAVRAELWTYAVPEEIHIVPDGLVLIGDFDRAGVLCASGPQGIFLPASDPMFREKMSLALSAKAAGKKIRALIEDPIEFGCARVHATGYFPVVSRYFWQLTD